MWNTIDFRVSKIRLHFKQDAERPALSNDRHNRDCTRRDAARASRERSHAFIASKQSHFLIFQSRFPDPCVKFSF